ncbi:MAG: rod shape-determining protein MreC [Christensenellales bacterium]
MHFWRNRPLMVTIIVLIILLALLVVTAGGSNMSGAESVAGSLFMPLQRALYSATDSIGEFFERIFSGVDAQTENYRLSARIAELEGLLQDYNEMKRENERLKTLLNFDTQDNTLEYKSARVIGKSPGHWFNMFIIDTGLSGGIKVNMPVVNTDGLVGRVVQTGANWSRVMAIIDTSSGVSGIVERTRDNGILSGSASLTDQLPLLAMSNLPLDADLMPGDTVITSGLAGVFPKGIRIGEVVEVSPSDDGMRNTALVRPWVNFGHLEEVVIITSKLVNVKEALE